MPEKKFKLFCNELLKWNKSINLIQSATEEILFDRHIRDSLQLKEYLKINEHVIVDIGSGAGFPGLVLAIDGIKNIHLVEPSTKKAIFLEHIKNLYQVDVKIHNCRWQELKLKNADIVISRAYAKLTDLLSTALYVSRETNSVEGIFLKGERLEQEIFLANKEWIFSYEIHDSSTCQNGKIVIVRNITRK